jgi:hypothetical protein
MDSRQEGAQNIQAGREILTVLAAALERPTLPIDIVHREAGSNSAASRNG